LKQTEVSCRWPCRWYDPHTGRFISQDPSGFGASDVNLYRYVHNAATLFVDPRGLREVRLTDDVGTDAPLNISSWDSDVIPTMEATGGMVGDIGTGGDASYIVHWKEPDNSMYNGFVGSIHKSLDSIALGWQGAYQQAIGDPRANATFDEAVKNSPQQQATGEFRKWVNYSLVVAKWTAALAAALMVRQMAASLLGLDPIPATELEPPNIEPPPGSADLFPDAGWEDYNMGPYRPPGPPPFEFPAEPPPLPPEPPPGGTLPSGDPTAPETWIRFPPGSPPTFPPGAGSGDFPPGGWPPDMPHPPFPWPDNLN
jgi:hypothetical protein